MDSDESGFEEVNDSPIPQIKVWNPSPKIFKSKPNYPESLPLVEAGHSLGPDMLFGWKPQIET